MYSCKPSLHRDHVFLITILGMYLPYSQNEPLFFFCFHNVYSNWDPIFYRIVFLVQCWLPPPSSPPLLCGHVLEIVSIFICRLLNMKVTCCKRRDWGYDMPLWGLTLWIVTICSCDILIIATKNHVKWKIYVMLDSFWRFWCDLLHKLWSFGMK